MNEINGLPTHVLLVHAVVVLVPLTALALITAAVLPRAARRLGPLLPLLASVALVSVPLTTQAGEWLEHHVDGDPLVRRHAELGDGLVAWAVGLFVLAAVVWWAGRRASAGSGQGDAGNGLTGAEAFGRDTDTVAASGRTGGSRWAALPVRILLGLLSVAVAVGAVVDVYRVGDSGAKAAWHDGYSQTATSSDHDGE
jgi:hypothetical protein